MIPQRERQVSGDPYTEITLWLFNEGRWPSPDTELKGREILSLTRGSRLFLELWGV